MKRIISILLLILIIMPTVVSCNGGNEGGEGTTDTIQNTPAGSESGEVTEAPIEDSATETVDLNQFVILYDNNIERNNALLLQEKIKEKTGLTLQMKRPSGGENAYELLISPNHRAISSDFVNGDFVEMCTKYGVLIENGKIYLAGMDKITIEKSMDFFVENYINGGSTVTIEKKINKINEIDFEKESIPAKNEDNNEIRVMTNNVIRFKYKPPAATRIAELKVGFAMFDADVIALQECGKQWWYEGKLIETLKTIGYEMVPCTSNECSNPLFYRPATVKLIESGDIQFDNNDTANDAYRSYAWGCFEQISTGKKFIATSTHLHPDNETIRKESANQMLTGLKELEEKFSAPVVALGDYNSNYSSSVYLSFKTRFNSARDNCPVKVNMSYKTFIGTVGSEPVIGKAIDHCFYSKSGLTPAHFETIISKYGASYSDHLPVIFDFTLD